MFNGHDPYLVALSVVIAALGGYTGFGLAARIRATPGASRRLLLAGAAAFLGIGIWTMHFIGMLAAPLPPDAVHCPADHRLVPYLALVVGVSVFFVSIGEPSKARDRFGAALCRHCIDALRRHPCLSGDFRRTRSGPDRPGRADRDRRRLRGLRIFSRAKAACVWP
jgi:NO-binding membrane sensor protein with MHYT domain